MRDLTPIEAAWVATIDEKAAREYALRVMQMEGGNQAVAHVAVELFELKRQLEHIGSPWYVQAAKGVGLLAATVGAAVASWKTGIGR